MTTRPEFAEVLERFASQVIELPGVSRTRPHAFAEAKDALCKAMMSAARDLRTPSRPLRSLTAAVMPGPRVIRGTLIPVETRRRRSG